MSEADTLYVTAAPPGSSVSTFWSPGSVSVGGVVSVTVTENDACGEETFPVESVAVQSTGVVPTGNVEPEVWSQTMVGLGSTLSVAAIVHETAAPPGPVASVVESDGTVVNVGGSVSSRVTMTLKP